MSTAKAQDADLFSEKTEMERSLGLTEALSILIGRIIGSGIFRTPASIMMLRYAAFPLKKGRRVSLLSLRLSSPPSLKADGTSPE